MRQQETYFFDPNGNYPQMGIKPTDEEIRNRLRDCPLDRFVTGPRNQSAILKLKRFVFATMQRCNHDASDFSFALLGGPSTGKTFLSKLFHETIAMGRPYPFAEVQPKAVGDTDDVFEIVKKSCADSGLALVPDEMSGQFVTPSMIVFIDEVHALAKGLMEGGLLNATEADDGWLRTKKGIVCDCRSVCWIVATTDAGKLFDAFHSRFHKIELFPASQGEVAEIVHRNFRKLNMDVCMEIAKYCRLPRDAKRFAKEVGAAIRMHPELSIAECVLEVAKGNGLDEYGMHWKQLAVLKALGRVGPISKGKLGRYAKCKTEELEKFVLPPLEEFYEDRSALIITTSRGYSLTKAGIEELQKRKIVVSAKALEAA